MPLLSTRRKCMLTSAMIMPGTMKHVQCEEARQRFARYNRPGQQQMHQLRAYQRHPPRDGGSDAETPISVLIEAHAPGR